VKTIEELVDEFEEAVQEYEPGFSVGTFPVVEQKIKDTKKALLEAITVEGGRARALAAAAGFLDEGCMNLTEAVARACQEPTIIKALEWIAVWENGRAVEQAIEAEKTGVWTGANGAKWDTCFGLCFREVFKAWEARGGPEPVLDVLKVFGPGLPPHVFEQRLVEALIDEKNKRILTLEAELTEANSQIDSDARHLAATQEALQDIVTAIIVQRDELAGLLREWQRGEWDTTVHVRVASALARIKP